MIKIPVMHTDEESNQFLDSEDGRELVSHTFRVMLEAARNELTIPQNSPYGTVVARQEVIISAAVKSLAVIMCLGPESEGSAAVLNGEMVSEIFPNVQRALLEEVNSFMRFVAEHGTLVPESTTTH